MAILVRTNGYVEDFSNDEGPLDLEQMQAAVGGNIEHVYTTEAGNCMIVNEEGGPELLNLPFNPVATAIAVEHTEGRIYFIFGNALIFEKDEFK